MTGNPSRGICHYTPPLPMHDIPRASVPCPPAALMHRTSVAQAGKFGILLKSCMCTETSWEVVGSHPSCAAGARCRAARGRGFTSYCQLGQLVCALTDVEALALGQAGVDKSDALNSDRVRS